MARPGEESPEDLREQISLELAGRALRVEFVRASGPGGQNVNKVATAEEIAAAVCFYLCEESGQTTLSTLLVDGGAALGSC